MLMLSSTLCSVASSPSMKRVKVVVHQLTDAEVKRLCCSHDSIKQEAAAEEMVYVTIPKSENPALTKISKYEVSDDELEDITVKEEPIDWHQEPQDQVNAASDAQAFKKEIDNACAEARTEHAEAEDELREGSSGACNTSAVHQRSAGASQGSADSLPSDVSGSGSGVEVNPPDRLKSVRFLCAHCDYSSVQKDKLQLHLREEHKLGFAFKCKSPNYSGLHSNKSTQCSEAGRIETTELSCKDTLQGTVPVRAGARNRKNNRDYPNKSKTPGAQICPENCKTPAQPFSSTGESRLAKENSGPTGSIPAKMFTKSARKAARQQGKEYFTVKGKFIDQKKFAYHQCFCRYKNCNAVSEDERKIIHEKFWASSNWQVQSTFICQTIRTSEPKRTSVQESRVKHSRRYFLGDKQVCKLVYIKTLGISSGRINYCLNRKNKNGCTSPDRRGRRSAPNKTPECKLEEVQKFLDSLPKFQSHYSQSDRNYLHPDLTSTKLYEMYCEKVKLSMCVHKKIFQRAFKKYNVPIYLPKPDTCETCDSLNMKIRAAEDQRVRLLLEAQRTAHCEQAEQARAALSHATNISKNQKDVLVFTFDLQKTQPLPHLTTSVAFYKRQLWLYNLGINTRHDNKGHMCVWLENEGKRGANEICSSILEFLHSQNLSGVETVKTFSNCCGGQTKNKTMICFMIWACQKFDFTSWEHQFMESGHSDLPNDSDFGKIEKRKKKYGPIYCKDTYKALLKEAQPYSQFSVTEMLGKFKQVDCLAQLIKFVETNASGESLDFLKLNWYKVSKENIVHFRQTDGNGSVQCIKFSSLVDGFNFDLNPAARSVKISKEKYQDLISLLRFVPKVHHKFYSDLEC